MPLEILGLPTNRALGFLVVVEGLLQRSGEYDHWDTSIISTFEDPFRGSFSALLTANFAIQAGCESA